MSRRRSIYTLLKRRCNGGEPPNAYIPEITVEIRAHFPPHISKDEVRAALFQGFHDAAVELDALLFDEPYSPEGVGRVVAKRLAEQHARYDDDKEEEEQIGYEYDDLEPEKK